jgi:hypothetical protein
MIWIVLLGYLTVHLLAYICLLRHLRVLKTERGILLYHLSSAAAAVCVACAYILSTPTAAPLTVIAGIAAAHAIYSLSFLEVWVLSEGGYSLRILAEIARTDGASRQAIEQHFASLSKTKKAGRLDSLTSLGLVVLRGSQFHLTNKGRRAAAIVALFAGFTRGSAN